MMTTQAKLFMTPRDHSSAPVTSKDDKAVSDGPLPSRTPTRMRDYVWQLEEIFQSKLNLPSRGSCQDFTEGCRIEIRVWIGQIDAIKDIERLDSQLNAFLLLLKINILEQPKSPVVDAWTCNDISSCAAKLIQTGFFKGGCVKPSICRRIRKTRVSLEIGTNHKTSRPDIGDVARDGNTNRLTRARRCDSVDLPSFQEMCTQRSPAAFPGRTISERQLVDVAHYEVMPTVERRQSSICAQIPRVLRTGAHSKAVAANAHCFAERVTTQN